MRGRMMVGWSRAATFVVASTGFLALVSVVYRLANASIDPLRADIFLRLILLYDAPAALLILLAVALAFLPVFGLEGLDRLTACVARHPRWTASFAFLSLIIIAREVLHAHPLALDEYAPYFQSQVFASGRLTADYPSDLIPQLYFPDFLDGFFIASMQKNLVISGYWPGFALLLTPFSALGVPWLLNPLLGACALLLIHHLTSKLVPEPRAAGWALLLGLYSSGFLIMAGTFYSMTAHLVSNLAFVALLLRPTPTRLLAAGLVGSFSLSLHNPVPHSLFAIPWFLYLLRIEGAGVKKVALLALGYVPLSLLLLIGWMLLRGGLADAPTEADGSFIDLVLKVAERAFTLPSREVLEFRLLGTSKLTTWAAPFLVFLAVWGGLHAEKGSALRTLFWSAVVTYLGYFLVPFSQGHGWGYRYFHSAWGALPVLAAAALFPEAAVAREQLERLRFIGGVGLVIGVLSCVQRALQTEEFVSNHLDQRPRIPDNRLQYVCFLRIYRDSYMQDLLQHDPDLVGHVLYFIDRGPAAQAELLRRYAPDARPYSRSSWGTVYELNGRPFAAVKRELRALGSAGVNRGN